MTGHGDHMRLIGTADIPALIDSLVDFLGLESLSRVLEQYSEQKKSHGDFYRHWHYERQHPWLEPLLRYANEPFSTSMDRIVDTGLHLVAADALDLQDVMTRSSVSDLVRKCFRTNLLAMEDARPHIFEIRTASHWLNHGGSLTWPSDARMRERDKLPEFQVDVDQGQFQIECKSVGIDTGRNMRRQDFYELVDGVAPEVAERGLAGEILIDLKKKLPTGKAALQGIARHICDHLAEGDRSSTLPDDVGKVSISLTRQTGIQLPQTAIWEEVRSYQSRGMHAAVVTPDPNGLHDPLYIATSPAPGVRIVETLISKLKAAREQIGEGRGLIYVLLQGFTKNDLIDLRAVSEFTQRVERFFESASSRQVGIVCLAGDDDWNPSRILGTQSTEKSAPALCLPNPNCSFEPPIALAHD